MRSEVYNSLVPSTADIKNWRGIIAEFTTECGKIDVVFSVSINTESGEISNDEVLIFIPPNNKCGKLIEALYPHLYADFFEGKDIKIAHSKKCRSFTEEITLCADVLLLVPDEGQITYTFSDCNNNSDCSKIEEEDELIIIWDLMMENN